MAKGNAIVMYLEQARIHGEPIGVTHSEVLFTKPNGYTVQPHNRVVSKAAPAEVQGEGFDGNMPVEKPKKKSKAGVIVAVVLAAVIGGGALGYAYVPAVYDGVNNVLTAVTGKQVGVPAPIPSNTGDGNAPTVSQPQLQQSSGTSENALNGIDLSGDVTIEFYATVRTADGREYKVPLSSANLTDGNLKSLLDGSGFTLTSGQ